MTGAENMARDHALALESRSGLAALRFYQWDPAALSFGRNEPAGDSHRMLIASRPDIDVVRRPTGGRAVLHDRELTYSVSYRGVNWVVCGRRTPRSIRP